MIVKKKIKHFSVLCLVGIMCIVMTVPVFAASKSNPSTSAYISSKSTYASMDIGSDSAYLEIMFLLTQINTNNADDVRTPQYFSTKSGSFVSGTKTPESGYYFHSGRYRYYVDNVNLDEKNR